MSTGYGPQVGSSREGYPIYLYTDSRTKLTTYVVVLPDGRAFYSDAQGRIVATPAKTDSAVALALVAGAAGLWLGGPVGGIIGAIFGAIMGEEVSKKRGA
jgi:hypothetical protein